ncbi:T9SS type A sorting domain-containing protein [Rufibacter psychrotolerans]|uniref:T9SS type A sorting domain-containing protein n=1 Tax=Rufibacter psychrotolerans TaxID=2812556 RepID=UPI0019686E70|nr:T9SS type A sorting domain-containing protein [Rufibacter sp. SYSU D00308]
MKTPVYALFLICLFYLLPQEAFSQVSAHVLWMQTVNGASNATPLHSAASALAKDPDGNVYMAGTFQGSAQLGTTTLQSTGAQSAFIAKYTSNGSLEWVKTITGTGLAEDLDLVVDATAIYVSGLFRGELNFNPGGTPAVLIGPDVNGQTGYSPNGFVAKYALETADLQWAKPILGDLASNGVYHVRLATSHGELFVSGAFLGELDFNHGGTALIKSSTGSSDGFLMKLNGQDGSTAWWRGVGGVNGEAISAIAANDEGLFVGGVFSGEADFNLNGTKPEVISSQGGSRNIFWARYHPGTGELDWLEQTRGTFSFSWVNALALDNTGIYMAGWFSTSTASEFGIQFPSTQNGIWELGCKGENDAFMAKFDYNTGKTSWLHGVGGAGKDYLTDLAVDYSGLYATGYFDAQTDVNLYASHNGQPAHTPYPVIKDNAGQRDLLLLKYGLGYGGFTWARSIGNAQDQVGMALLTDIGQKVYLAGAFGGTLNFNSAGMMPVTRAAQGQNTDAFLVKYENTLSASAEELDMHLKVRAYPNPASESLTLEVSPEMKGRNYVLKLVNSLGVTVHERQVEFAASGKQVVDLPQLPAGNYTLVLQNESLHLTKNFVKQ